jgi:peptide/nickel transport system permease protein
MGTIYVSYRNVARSDVAEILMIPYLARRLGTAVIVLFGVAAITFFLLHLIAPSPAQAVLGVRASPQAIVDFNRLNGYDRPVVVQFFAYLGNLLHGDLGQSYKLSQNVGALFAQNAGRSAFLSGAAMLLAVIVALPLGIYQAMRRNSVADYSITALAFILYSMPPFFLGLVLIEVFAMWWQILPFQASQADTLGGVLLDFPSMILPIVTLAGVQIAQYSRYTRSSTLDNLAQDYIGLARAKGLKERQILFGHLLRNSCLPLITLIGLSMPALLAGNLLVETLFNYPGLGLLFYHALQSQDYPILLAMTLIGGVLVVLGNLVADIASTIADPRIRL